MLSDMKRRLTRFAVLAILGAGCYSLYVARAGSHAYPSLDALPYATARRADLDVSILAPGVIECAKQVDVTCELERLTASAQGGSSTILSIVPEGTQVKEGDILCELDASEIKDLFEQQEIKVEQMRSEKMWAELDLEIAKISQREYREGTAKQLEKSLEAQIALAHSDAERMSDRLRWTMRMQEKGYASAAQVATEKASLERTRLAAEQAEMSLENFRRFSLPKEMRAFESAIIGAQATLDFQTLRLNRELERLELYKKQVDRCTIRAPHDGMVIYANRPGRAPEVYLEAPVRQRQRLFKIPDLSDLQVIVYLHETIVSRIQVGMHAKVKVEAVPDHPLEGRVVSVTRMPLMDRERDSSNEVKYFQGRIDIGEIPKGVMPGMTTQVVLETDQRHNALVVPVEAVVKEGKREYCYVLHEDHVERRPVQVDAATYGMIEITEGLNDGDRVVLSPLQQGLLESDLVRK
jgi:HlyD family secretion protein